MIWIKIIDYELENSEQKSKQSLDNYRIVIIAGMAHCKGLWQAKQYEKC